MKNSMRWVQLFGLALMAVMFGGMAAAPYAGTRGGTTTLSGQSANGEASETLPLEHMELIRPGVAPTTATTGNLWLGQTVAITMAHSKTTNYVLFMGDLYQKGLVTDGDLMADTLLLRFPKSPDENGRIEFLDAQGVRLAVVNTDMDHLVQVVNRAQTYNSAFKVETKKL